MQGEKAGQTKTRTFNKLRGAKASPAWVKSPLYQCKCLVIYTLKETKPQNAVSAAVPRPTAPMVLFSFTSFTSFTS